MKKSIFVLFWLLVCIGGIHAQQMVYNYSYDASGNRIRRAALVLSRDGAVDKAGESQATMLDDEGVRVFPNPTKGTLIIETTNGENISHYRLSDAQGKRLQATRCENPSLRIDLSDRPDGLYFLEVFFNSEVRNYQIIKQ